MTENRCMGCMKELDADASVCPYCGFDKDKYISPEMTLPPGTLLGRGKYLIGKTLGQGGFGVTYIALDQFLELRVAIKEYLPRNMAYRDGNSATLHWHSSITDKRFGRDSFVKEAKKMAKMDDIPGIVRVKEVFYENDTAYIVMDYVEGDTLLKRLEKTGALDGKACFELLRPVMDSLAEAHRQGMIHRDISPDNIMLDRRGRVWLLDMGAAKEINVTQSGQGAHSSTVAVVKEGFSPLEQYASGPVTGKKDIGAWTDVYAMSATIFYCMSGSMLPPAPNRVLNPLLELPDIIPPNVSQVLLKGLAVMPKERIRSMEELRDAFAAAVGAPDDAEARRKAEEAKRREETLRQAEEARRKAEEQARQERECQQAEEAKRQEEERRKTEIEAWRRGKECQKAEAEARRQEEERWKADEEARRQEEERQKAEAAARRQEEERRKAEEQARQERERQQAEEARRLKEKRRQEEQARQEREFRQAEETRRKQMSHSALTKLAVIAAVVVGIMLFIRMTSADPTSVTPAKPSATTVTPAKPAVVPSKPADTPSTPVVAIVASGTSDTGLTWTLDENGLLTVSGTGEMHDFTYQEDEKGEIDWLGYRNQVKVVNIGNGVTTIGQYAFRGCINLTNITIPNSVTQIGEFAFYKCDSLGNIAIPDSVTKIGRAVFSGCSHLSAITIPDSVTEIAEDFFVGCASLKNVIIPNGVSSIGAYAFSDCSSLSDITIPDSVIELGSETSWSSGHVFSGCTSLSSIVIPNSVAKISAFTFYNCTNLSSVVISDSVTMIEKGAFVNCIELSSIAIPDSVTEIGEGAFEGCSSLSSVIIPEGVVEIGIYAFASCKNLTSITIAEGVTAIGEGAFSDCTNLSEVTVPSSMTEIGENAFIGCDSLESVAVPEKAEIAENAFPEHTTVTPYNDIQLRIRNNTIKF